MRPPSPPKPRSGQIRTSPPRLTTTCLRLPRPSTRTRWLVAWTAPGSHPWTVTRVRSAPSATVTSTVWVRAAVPVWSRMTVPREPACAWTRTCWATGAWAPVASAAASRSRPVTDSRTARAGRAPAARVTTVAVAKAAQAVTPARSTGAPTVPRRGSSRPTRSTVAPDGTSAVTVRGEEGASSATSVSSWRRGAKRLSGVKRHSSSRPVGTGMSAGSKLVGRSAREET